ncbi:hypothetical protein [Planotetraspora kaengkrachanensis]|uniref:Uncharacterized protein n=1 Tax=Planotetraspora kaengkrachanensis TaxID=575193 RepID=A0A8J3M632_9ACTN|nr:hypothetical protein [Planotetraspora kaengkrachanensis]GIG80139.1 hypothetical protein Pka01_32660 [Planotetraspora kaengkrachanensis]
MPPETSRTPPGGRRGLPLGSSAGRVRARRWPASGKRATAAQAAKEQAELRRGLRFRSLFLTLMGVVLAVAALDVLLGAVGLIQETRSRPLTDQERAQYAAQDVARRWHAWPVGMVFPEELPYNGLGRAQQYAHRVGVAPEEVCTTAVDSPVASVLREQGCRTMLRATYVDQTSTFAITVGVAVLRDEEARLGAAAKLPVDDRVGVRPVAFPGTVTDTFGSAQRQRTGWVGAGPYIVFSTVGYTDGRTRDSVPMEEQLNSEMWPAAESIAGRIARALGEPPDVPRCTQGNVC